MADENNETVHHHDFIEVEYTGKLTDGTVFDTTSERVAKQHHLPAENRQFSSPIICVGEQQLLPGLDKELEGKEVGKSYTITLSPEQAFGKRDIKKMKIIPMSTFYEHKMEPHPGLQIDVDGEVGTVMRVSGGRVMVNFNHLLAGKEIIYEIRIQRKVTEPKEQITAYLNMGLRIPAEKIKVEIRESARNSGEESGVMERGERKATVTLPFQLPAPFTSELGKKLAELTGLKEVTVGSSSEL
ncbi:MAG: peptidylprolyl isomerase [Nanoarchaeota archaeon]